MITKDRAKELLGPYLDESITYRDHAGIVRKNDGLTMQHSSALLLALALFEGNEKAFLMCEELINFGNPLVVSRRALEKARSDERMLLKCRVWIEDGLMKKLDTAFGELPS